MERPGWWTLFGVLLAFVGWVWMLATIEHLIPVTPWVGTVVVVLTFVWGGGVILFSDPSPKGEN